MEFTDAQILEIAEELGTSMVCYIHLETGDIKFLPADSFYMGDEYMMKDVETVEADRENYYKIERMSSKKAFRMMEHFIMQLQDERIKGRLEYALETRRPFRAFKDEINRQNNFIREMWFSFQLERQIEYVKQRLESFNRQAKI